MIFFICLQHTISKLHTYFLFTFRNSLCSSYRIIHSVICQKINKSMQNTVLVKLKLSHIQSIFGHISVVSTNVTWNSPCTLKPRSVKGVLADKMTTTEIFRNMKRLFENFVIIKFKLLIC